MKRISMLVLIVISITLFHAIVFGESTIKVSVNGSNLVLQENPIVMNGRVLVPLRAIFEAVGVEPIWDSQTQTVTAKSDFMDMKLTIGSKTAVVNGSIVQLETAGVLVNGSTMVPVRFIAETFGSDVKWNSEARLVSIITNKQVTTSIPNTTGIVPSAVSSNTLSVSPDHTVALRTDGTVIATGANEYGQCDVNNWHDIVAVATGQFHTIGLKKDGTVIAVGNSGYDQCYVNNWTDITAIATSDLHTVGLKKDGTVLATASYRSDVYGWNNIIKISVGNNHTVGLKQDGTVMAGGDNDCGECNVGTWNNIVAIATGYHCTVGIKKDGTVVWTGSDVADASDPTEWKAVQAIAASDNCIFGLKKNGTVVASASGYDVSTWTDISEIAVNSRAITGLKKDGTVVTAGMINAFYGDFTADSGYKRVSEWKNIKSIYSSDGIIVGLKDDGTIVAVGDNEFGQCNVEKWKDVGQQK